MQAVSWTNEPNHLIDVVNGFCARILVYIQIEGMKNISLLSLLLAPHELLAGLGLPGEARELEAEATVPTVRALGKVTQHHLHLPAGGRRAGSENAKEHLCYSSFYYYCS